MKSDLTATRFFYLLLAGSVLLLALVMRPLLGALFMGAVLAGFMWPLNRWLAKLLRDRRSLAAGMLTLAVILAIVGPMVTMSTVVIKEAAAGLEFLEKTLTSGGVPGLLEQLPAPLQKVAHQALESLTQEPGAGVDDTVGKQFKAQGGKAAGAAGAVVSAAGSLMFDLAVMLIALFFFLVQGEELVAWIDARLPLRKGQTAELLAEFKRVSFAVILSTVVTSAVQAAAALIGYTIAQVPHSLFFAEVTFFAAFIPAIGAGSICLAAAVLLGLTGHPYMAIFLAIWGVLVVGLVDNFVKPFLIKRGMEMHGAVVFFALLGGLAAFGPVGLLLGPLIVSLFLALLRIYERDFAPTHQHLDEGM